MTRTAIQDDDRGEVRRFIEKRWHGPRVMSRGREFFPHQEQGLIERRGGRIVGLLTYHVDEEGMELLTLDSTLEGKGIGSALMLDAIAKSREIKCDRIWLTTTNDKLRAIGFYQRLGFRMAAINLGVVDEARKIKPEIPLVGERGVEIHDEVVMELTIEPYLTS